jgi:hypothetical protein
MSVCSEITDAPLAAFTIKEFCRTHRLSVSTYYKIQKFGFGPREKRIDSHVIITQEAAAEWRAGQDISTR